MVDYNSLRPEQRSDKNGKLTTRWVRDGAGNTGASSALSQARVSAGATTKFPVDVNWDSISIGAAEGLAESFAANVDDPDKLWQNFDFYTNMLNSDHAYTAMVTINENNVATRLRDAWLNKHGMTLADKQEYAQIDGDEGYLSYHDAHVRFVQAGAGAADRVESNDPTLIKPRPLDEILGAPSSDISGAGENADIPLSNLSDSEFEEQFEKRSKAAYDEVDKNDLDFKEKFEEYADRAYEALDGIGEAIADRHTSEIPASAGVSTVAWSDLNPFKRWGKKK